MVERGQPPWDQKVFVDPTAIVANSPRTQPRTGGDMTLHELCHAALQVSDNTVGNLLLKTIGGPSAITAFARSIGGYGSTNDLGQNLRPLIGELTPLLIPELLGEAQF